MDVATEQAMVDQVAEMIDDCEPAFFVSPFIQTPVTACGWALVGRVARRMETDRPAAVEALLLAGAERLGVALTAGERRDMADVLARLPVAAPAA